MRTGELYQRYNGLYLGTVVSTKDPEGLGRVRVKMDQYEDSDSDPVFAAVSRPIANGQTTVFFSPQKDDQVIVGFLTGDVNEPVILGYAHSNQKKPPSEVSPPSKHGVVTSIGSVIFDEAAQRITVNFGSAADPDGVIVMDNNGIAVDARRASHVVRVNGGDQNVARVDDAIDAGTILITGPPGTVAAAYFPAGVIGEGLADGAKTTAEGLGLATFKLSMTQGLVTSGANRFKA